MDSDQIEQLIQNHIDDAQVSVSSDDNVHFEARVVSSAFEGLPMLKRHRLVYAALGDRMGREIHALSLEALTPEQAAEADS